MTISEVREELMSCPEKGYVRAVFKGGDAPFTVTRETRFFEFDYEDLEATDWEEDPNHAK